MSKECEKPRNPATVTCRNCDESEYLVLISLWSLFMY